MTSPFWQVEMEHRCVVRRARWHSMTSLITLLSALVVATVAHATEPTASDSKEGATGMAEKAAAGADTAKGNRVVEGAEREADEKWAPVLYIPPSRGQARRTAAGGTRTLGGAGSAVQVAVLAPKDHVALTTRAQPVLYWYLSESTAARIDVTLIDEEGIDPLLEITVAGPVEAGIHSVDLAKHGIELQPGQTYRWHVALVQDARRRSTDTVAEGLIERTGVSAALSRSLREARNPYAPYALSGIWYDAIAELRTALGEDPSNRRLLLQEVALLEQAELSQIARFARAARP